jgi:N,N'-diacetyllegionaminate synthase
MRLIAETAWHHDGDFEFLRNLVQSICENTACEFIKYHVTLDVDEYMHTDHPGYEWAKERMFSKEQWTEIFDLTTKSGKKLMLLFNDQRSVEFGMSFDPELVEIHSVCLNDVKLLESLKSLISGKQTQVVLGVGGTDLYEIEHAMNFLDHKHLVMMHGFQNYPTQYQDINFSKIRKIMSLYPSVSHGYADHTAWNHENNVFITLMGAAQGMEYIEKHVTIQPGEGRTDWQAAVTMDVFLEVQEKMKVLAMANGDGYLKMNKGEEAYSTFGAMKKAAVLNKDVKKGATFSMSDIDFKRTGQSSNVSQVDVIKSEGLRFSKDISQGITINREDLIQ